MPPLNKIQTDFDAEYRQIWTAVCAKYGVSHINEIPKRSQSQGGSEISIELLKQGLARICASQEKGRQNWPDMLPKLIQTLNSYFPYKRKLSRAQLPFSPFYNASSRLDVKKPLRLQKSQFQELNAKRMLKTKKVCSGKFCLA